MITSVKGDILMQDVDIIAHQVNTLGIMGAGLANQIAENYPDAYLTYHQYCTMCKDKDIVGDFIPTKVYNEGLKRRQIIANCFTQKGVNLRNERHTDLEAIKTCFTKLKEEIKQAYPDSCSIAIPYKYGCGLADGNWDEVFPIFKELFESEEKIELVVCSYFDR